MAREHAGPAVDGPGEPRRSVALAKGTAYVSVDGHRMAKLTRRGCSRPPTTARRANITNNLPVNNLFVIEEDIKNPNLLFAASLVPSSLNGGQTWKSLSNNLPTVAVHDLVVHTRDNDLLAATPGAACG